MESADPCKPYCVCHEGRIVCAEITCTDDFELPHPKAVCSKLHVNPKQRCCHQYLCGRFPHHDGYQHLVNILTVDFNVDVVDLFHIVLEDGTGTMVYPLPLVSAPDELYA